MDLHLIENASATSAERHALDNELGTAESGWQGATRDAAIDTRHARNGHDQRSRRHLLMPALWALQEHVGWISPGGLNELCKRLSIPPADGYGVATFYAMFACEPRPARVVHVCEDVACKCVGSDDLIAQLEERVGPEGELSDDGSTTWYRSPCLGQCDRAPAALLTVADATTPSEHVYAPTSAAAVLAVISGETVAAGQDPVVPLPQHGDPELRLLSRVGVIDPIRVADYRAAGGYEALRRAVELGPEGVLREVRESKLLGRGGAAFPTGIKWEAVAKQAAGPHYLICNADESEPGTFKDRAILEGDPFSLIEAMTIAGYATRSEYGYIYLRGEYPQALRIVQEAIDDARRRGFLGDNVMGEGFSFELEIRKGAGAYICGEETAIFNSIEGFRGEPRNKPPFPVVEGLFAKPTVINNVETLINVLDVVRRSGPGFSETGTEASTGTKLFCLSGNIVRPGVYEVPFGTTLRELLELAGGVDGTLQTILLGGAAGGFIRPDELDLPLTFEAAREAKTTLGSGVVLVLNEHVDLKRVLMRIAAFFRNESCGQCVPCRVGTVRQQETLARLCSGNTRGDELVLIGEIGQVMRDASICGLGQTASSAIESAIDRLGVFS